MVYIIIAMFSICILSSICCYNYSHTRPLIQPVRNVSLPIPMMLINSMNNINSMNSMNINLNEECCICLDINNIQSWSILPCGHKFHSSCVSTWLHNHQTCPVCRCDITNVP